MQFEAFFKARQADWDALSRLVQRGQQNLRALSPEEVQSLSRLYRAATSDLALAQRDFPGHRVTVYLNQLVARSHALIYQDQPLALNRLRRFITRGFPQVFRQALPFFLVAALCFFGPAVVSGALTAWRPASAQWLVPQSGQRLIAQIEEGQLWTDIPLEERPYASSFIAQNNIQVAFLAFAAGVLAAIPTVVVLINNGLLLGSITGLTWHYGLGDELWSFVIGHGVIELTVICIAGASGLMLGWALLHPGWLSRRDALALAAQQAVRLIIGCVPLLLIAGLIEGLISPNEFIPAGAKWGIGLGSGVLLYSYLLLAGRPRRTTGASWLSSPNSD